jgi:hypothetical protein
MEATRPADWGHGAPLSLGHPGQFAAVEIRKSETDRPRVMVVVFGIDEAPVVGDALARFHMRATVADSEDEGPGFPRAARPLLPPSMFMPAPEPNKALEPTPGSVTLRASSR